MVFTNKHVIIAMLVAPVLAVLAWFAVGEFAGEKPQAAVSGKSYPLLEKSNCRYPSAACDLENEDFRVRVTAGAGTGGVLLVRASHPLEGVVLAVGSPDEETPPVAMHPVDKQRLEWRIELGQMPTPTQRIRLVAMADGSRYFADAASAFLQEPDRRGDE